VGVRQYFDPSACRIILSDQRGCGRSTPQLAVSSGVHDKSEAFVLEAHELADSGGDEQAARNQMRLDLCNDLVDRLLI
jgi:pimeloyl-ACP methyl ester carboxylesterase